MAPLYHCALQVYHEASAGGRSREGECTGLMAHPKSRGAKGSFDSPSLVRASHDGYLDLALATRPHFIYNQTFMTHFYLLTRNV